MGLIHKLQYFQLFIEGMKPALDIKQKKQQPHQDIFFNKKIVAPQKLKILVLSGNDIVSQQLQFLHKCTNLLKLDLSNNHITKLPPKIGMDKLTKLQILYLHRNRIENAASLEGVFTLNKLTHLTIRDNPVEGLPRIQHLIVNVMPTLKVIGDRIVFVEERSPEFFQTRPNVYIQSQVSEGWKSKDNSQAHYIKILQLQLKYFDNVWARSNPIVLIQRAWKISLKQKRTKRVHQRRKQNQQNQSKQLSSEPSQIFSKLKQFFNEWRKFTENRKSVKECLSNQQNYDLDKLYLTYPLKEYHLAVRNLKVTNVIKNYLKYIRNKIFLRKMAERVYRQLKKKAIEFNSPQSFYTLCKIDTCKRFYFNKIQTHLLQNFIAHMQSNFHWQNSIKTQTSTGPVTHYLSIRTVDPQTFSVKTIYSTFTYSMWPSMRAIFLKKKKFESKHKTGIIKIKPLIYIKNMNKVLTKQQYKKSCKVYKQLQKFYKKQYENSLDYFQCQNQEIMKMLIRYIYYHNSKSKKFQKKLNKNDMQSLLENYQEPFMIYADCLLERSAAAVRIQQNWRKYVVQKNSKESIYAKMKKTRAVLRIQRFWRDHIFYHRLAFQRNIYHQLKLFNTNSFMIPSQMYLKFRDFCKEDEQNDLYQGLTLTKSPKNSLAPFWIFAKPVYSPTISRTHFPSILPHQQQSSNFCSNWNILHLNSSVTKIEYANEQFYQFRFESVEDAKFRIFLMALLSYRCRYSAYFLPLSRDTLDLVQVRFGEYGRMGLLDKRQGALTAQKKIKSKTALKIRQERSANSTNKITIIKILKENGVFLSTISQNLKQPIKYPINIQFYQKIFQDFPKKYISDLFYSLTDEIEQEKLLEKQKMVEELVQEKYLEEEQLEGETRRKVAKSSIQARSQENYLNISKIDRKRLSFYDYGGTTEVIKNQEKPKTRGEFFYEQAINKKQNISKVKVEQSTRKQQNVQKRSQNLKKLRQQMQKQRAMNATAKNLKEFERTEELKRKIEKVKEMKSRASSLRKEDHEDDFIQQGNFVMEQQLKMVIMRSKMQSLKPTKIRERQKSDAGSKRHSDTFSKSFYTQEKNKQIKVYEHPSSKPVAYSLGGTLNLTNPNQPQIAGQERKIINMRSQKRNKSRSIGAYLRDPSLVHGVFPEQYYPIESKEGGAFKFFPPLL